MQLAPGFKVEGKARTAVEALTLADDIEAAVGALMIGKLKPARLDVGLLTGAVQALRDHVRPAAVPDAPRPSITFMKGLIEAFYGLEGNYVGGSLHVVLDDGNLEDSSVHHCREFAFERKDADGIFLADLMLKFTEDERAEMLGIAPTFEEEDEAGA